MPEGSSRKSDRIDALLWLAISCALLAIVPVGFASNDGVGHSLAFSAGRWHLNPNHLLFEPLGAWWQRAVMALGYPREPFDALRLLSIVTGSLALGLFRVGVAPRIAAARFEANHATAWMAFSSAFLRLWISDETHMIQMPAITAMLWIALRCIDRPSRRRFFWLGVAIGVAALAFISNVLIGAAIAATLIISGVRDRISAAASTIAGLLVTAAPPLFIAWLNANSATTFFDWLTRYGGATVPARIRDAYGIGSGASALLVASLRALYGAACAIVDVTSLGAALRDHTAPALFACGAAIVLIASAVVLTYGAVRQRSNAVLLIVSPATLAIVVFGIYWNNSDDQFYFQLAPLAGMLVCVIRRRAILVLSAVCLSWNVCDVAVHRIFYPRSQRLAIIERETTGACLAITPGFDEAELLLEISHRQPPQTSIATTAIAYRYDAGMSMLSSRIDRCLASGQRVVFIDIFDTPRDRNPWKFLRRLGYDRDRVEQTLERVPIETRSRRVGPFTFRAAETK